uniref:Serine/arginine repetitive matrix protein 1 n=1 Tax=Ananas comosus var. bracteatus TaxID=296719 RepID=A0A6V7PNC2_ANACO|nr:unnamed protein product [Ananas comosus var. bracteatus]
MSLLQYPDAAKSENLQVWNNAAFDGAAASGGCSDAPASAAKLLLRKAPPPLQPLSANRPDRLDLDPIKENRSPVPRKKSPAPTVAAKRAPRVAFKEQPGAVEDEIEKIEKEVERLSARLQELRLKKGEGDRDSHASSAAAAAAEKRGRIVPAKFMDPTKQSAAESPAPDRTRRRGVSLGPLEILGSPCPAALLSRKQCSMQKGARASTRIEESPATAKSRRRGLSLGPLDIHGSIKSKPLGKPEATPPPPPPPPPPQSVQSRRRSSVFKKLQGIEEKRSSPQSRPPAAAKALDTRKGTAKSAGPKPIGVRPRGVLSTEIATSSSIQTLQQNKLRHAKEKPVKGDKQRSSSASPKSRKQSAAKASELRKGIATAGAAKKPVKRDGASPSVIKPKALFRGDENTAGADKGPSKSTKFRVVASRYSLAPSRVGGGEPESKRRKWSLPEANTSQLESQVREGEIIDDDMQANQMHSTSGGQSPSSVTKVAEMLPRIKTLRCTIESPRDSGCAKRVAELVGRKPYFGAAEGDEGVSSFPELNFEEEE